MSLNFDDKALKDADKKLLCIAESLSGDAGFHLNFRKIFSLAI